MAISAWFWLAGVTLTAVLAVWAGAQVRDVAAAAALGFAPALASLILLPRLDREWARLGVAGAWLVCAAGLVAGSGGAASPVVAALAIGPAAAALWGSVRVPEAGAAAALAYVLAVWLSQFGAPGNLGAFPEMLAALSLAFIAGLLGASVRRDEPTGADLTRRVAEVSHELRTPLTHILGFSEMIERQIFGEIAPRYVEYASLIRKSGAHLLGLVNDLLDLSRIDAGHYELQIAQFDARAVVDEVVKLSADSAMRKEITLGASMPEGALNVRADDRALKRMLINIVGNAIKFTPEGGRVMVSARGRGADLVLETADTGPGIPEAERAALGRAYVRGAAGAQIEGTGLGLSLVRALAGLHGGELTFHEAPGGGALVRIRLPILTG
ncbi:MAG: HAMP domain-containing sensor histidine kinase [Hyphomonadaceae bacterium]